VLGVEDYNRLARMIERGVKPRMAVDLAVAFHDQDLNAYNTVAEIPGTKRPKEVVMLGGHLDSWHLGTGATDDAVGVAAAMEAVRIIQALRLKPDRTIRVGLWAGEEQGLLGSRAYVNAHFGYYTNITNPPVLRSPRDSSQQPRLAPSTNRAPTRKLVRLREYDQFSAYFNLDNGGGRIRGVYLQNNEAVRPLFREWLRPFRDLGADTLTIQNTGGTDHLAFDAIGLPGFQFIQDPLDYWTRTHHANSDTLERVPPEVLKQAAAIMAVFAYRAAMLEEKLPRKSLE
jgi:Zn-dependent M28 family amino/carboxypeptidase